MLKHIAKAYKLMMVSVIEVAAPFARMIALSHVLSLTELGFVSAITATLGAFEQMTDFAVYRYVFSAPHGEHRDAMAGAQGIAILRGLLVGCIAFFAAPLVANAFSLGDEFLAFALIGPVIAIRGLEHLGPRVAEREYSYGAQLKVSLSANVAGLLALGVGLLFARTHVAFIVSMYVQVVVQVAASHLLAKEPYTVAFRTRHFRGAFRFGYPLMVNGFGLAASNNGDRFLIGAMLGLPSLAVYAVVTLATIVPLGLVSRVTGPVMLAALYNAGDRGSYDARLRLAARVLTMVSAFYAVGVASLVNVVVPIVFGEKFTLSPTAAALLAASLFIRVARGDPFTGMLLHEGRTRRLAVANLCSASSLGFEVVFLYAFHSFEAVMAGRLAGEVVGMVATILATRDLFKPAIVDFAKAFAMGSIVLAAAITAVATIPAPQYLMGSFVVVVSFVVMASWGAYFVPSLLEAGYPNIRIRNGLPA